MEDGWKDVTDSDLDDFMCQLKMVTCQFLVDVCSLGLHKGK